MVFHATTIATATTNGLVIIIIIYITNYYCYCGITNDMIRTIFCRHEVAGCINLLNKISSNESNRNLTKINIYLCKGWIRLLFGQTSTFLSFPFLRQKKRKRLIVYSWFWYITLNKYLYKNNIKHWSQVEKHWKASFFIENQFLGKKQQRGFFVFFCLKTFEKIIKCFFVKFSHFCFVLVLYVSQSVMGGRKEY